MIKLLEGNVYYAYPENEAAKIHDDFQRLDDKYHASSFYGWHGNDINPINLKDATWVADGRIGDPESDGALVVLLDGEMTTCDLAEWWKCRKVVIPDGWFYVDQGGGYRIRHFYDNKFVTEVL